MNTPTPAPAAKGDLAELLELLDRVGRELHRVAYIATVNESFRSHFPPDFWFDCGRMYGLAMKLREKGGGG